MAKQNLKQVVEFDLGGKWLAKKLLGSRNGNGHHEEDPK